MNRTEKVGLEDNIRGTARYWIKSFYISYSYNILRPFGGNRNHAYGYNTHQQPESGHGFG
jgi:hypothetical protein